MKKILLFSIVLLTGLSFLFSAGAKEKTFDFSKSVMPLTREEGSGTRGAFIELFGIEEKDQSGKKVDRTNDSFPVTDSTTVMMQSVSADLYSIGYISLGSLNDSVKAVKIDGVRPSVENIKNGSYKISRPFIVATKEDVKSEVEDFLSFVLSSNGQEIVEKNGYISNENTLPYKGKVNGGKIVISGSSSVSPLMEKLKEAYNALNPSVKIELQQSDSSSGLQDAIDSSSDIALSSRELKESELKKGLIPIVIAKDGIAVIVNNANPVDNISKEMIKEIYVTGEMKWSDVE